MRALVTGAASLVGSHLCELLVGDGNEVVAIDDLSSGTFGNLKHLLESDRLVFLEHDVARQFDAEVDAVFHLAVPSSRRRCVRDPGAAAVTCAAGTKHVLELAARRGVPVVLATSIERFGGGVECAEWLVRQATAADVRIVRAPATFGPGMDPDPEDPVARAALRVLAYGVDAPPSSRAIGELDVAWAEDVALTIFAALEAPRGEELVVPVHRITTARLASIVTDAIRGEEPLDAEDDLASAIAETAEWFASRWQTLDAGSGVQARGRHASDVIPVLSRKVS
jgi:nucleoside-diphosphate-sugar epimerase